MSSSIATGMYIIDKDFKMVYCNKAMQESYPEVKVGDVCHKVLAGLEEPCSHCPVFQGSSLFYSPFRGEWIEAQAAGMELPGMGDGYSIQFQVKQRLPGAKEELADREDLEDHIQELGATSEGACLIGGYCEPGFPIFYVNDNMVKLLGYDSKDELVTAIDSLVINTIHPDDRAQVQKDLGGTYYPGMTYETLYRMPKKDGTWFWTIDKGKVLETQSGRLAIISACMDMTSFVSRQHELAMLNADLNKKVSLSATMMNNMPSGYHRCAAKPGCPFTFVGTHFESIVGWTKEEIEKEFDNLYVNLVWPEDAHVVNTYENMLKMQGHGNSYSTDIYRMKRKGGGYRWVLDSTMFVDIGEDSFFQATIADITDFIETQERQKQEIKEANDAKTQFLSSMSHDIRTPMNAIIGMTTLASKNLDNPEYMRKCLSKMGMASNHLLTLINDVLDISKVESGKMSLNPIVFSLADTVTSLVNIVRHQIGGKGQKFDVRVHNIQREYLFGDELRLNQIFINILTNAVKYTPEGGRISLDLKEELVENNPDMVRVIYIVEDNGVGMSQEFQENMYASFVRANNENHGAIQGTGLGLTISKKMVDLMGGKIECDSQIGKGTKFTITIELPIADRIMEDYILPPMEVLLVDDDEIFLESAVDTLESMGISPDCVSSGEAAMEAVIERHRKGTDYPVIIIDWQMPDMNGIDTIREIRKHVSDEVTIIVVSAYEWVDIEEAALAAGADGFISKPFFPSNVYENMLDILGIQSKKQEEHENYTCTSVKGMRILVAEDNDLNWEIAKEMLAIYEVNTFHAENGQKCVEMLETAEDGAYDLVLMDIKMPIMNGYDACIAIRNSERNYLKNIPIIAMTADAFSEDIQRCINVGMNGHIAKPININTLLECIGKAGGGWNPRGLGSCKET